MRRDATPAVVPVGGPPRIVGAHSPPAWPRMDTLTGETSGR